jgi:hypothetical protein
MATCKKESVVIDPCMAEALGVRWCLQLAHNQGLQRVQIQIDALVVAECIIGKRTNASLEPIIVDCIELLSTCNFPILELLVWLSVVIYSLYLCKKIYNSFFFLIWIIFM